MTYSSFLTEKQIKNVYKSVGNLKLIYLHDI